MAGEHSAANLISLLDRLEVDIKMSYFCTKYSLDMAIESVKAGASTGESEVLEEVMEARITSLRESTVEDSKNAFLQVIV